MKIILNLFLIITFILLISILLQYFIFYGITGLKHSEDIYHRKKEKNLFYSILYLKDYFNNKNFNIYINETIYLLNVFKNTELQKNIASNYCQFLIKDNYTDNWKYSKFLKVIFFTKPKIITITFEK